MPKPQLFLLHFAGGNCYSFQTLIPFLRDFEIKALELPGRGRRIGETLLKDFDQAAEDFYYQVGRQLTAGEFLIYGHSMGAYLALRVTSMLERAGRYPAHLLVSGNPGPGARDNRKRRYLLKHEAFVEELKQLGGAPEAFLQDKDLFEFFEPILRADFEVSEKDELDGEPIVNAPIFAMMGDQEEYVEKIANWGRFTRSDFQYEIMKGDHFFIFKHPERIAKIFQCTTKNII